MCTKVSLSLKNPHDDVLDAYMVLYDAFTVFFNRDVQIKIITAGTGGRESKKTNYTLTSNVNRFGLFRDCIGF